MANKLTRSELTVLISVSCANLFFGMCYSMQSPFYPREAEKKKATATEYGLVLGCYELVCCIISPICGKLIRKTGCKMMMGVGLIFNSIILAMYGGLDFINDTTTFLILSFTLRILEAIFATASIVASFSLCCCTFPDTVATFLSITSIFISLGFAVGPAIGGVLFDRGGFPLPFFSVGAVSGLVSIVILIVTPSVTNIENTDNEKKSKILNIIKQPGVLVCVIGGLTFPMSQLFYCAILEPHLRHIGVSTLNSSLIFGASGIIFLVTYPFMGWLIDSVMKPKHLLIIACLLNIAGNVLIGPWPYLPIPDSLEILLAGLFLTQLAGSAGYNACSVGIVKSGMKIGLPANVTTFGLMSSIWNSIMSLGSFIGPSVAGILFDKVGFQYAVLFVAISNVIMLIITVVYLFIHKPDSEEKTTVKNGGRQYDIIQNKVSDERNENGETQLLEK